MFPATFKRFTISEYHRLTELGILQPSDRIELIRGELVKMAAKGTAHEVCLTKLLRELSKLISERATLRCQSPIILSSNSEPEPDFTIVINRPDDYLASHPTGNDIILVIEISDSSLDYDKEIKLPLYAEDGISDFWIFNLGDRILEAYSKPYQKPQGSWGYRIQKISLPDETISLPQFSDLLLDLAKVFPNT
ncbi:Uma2 family endonuclease [Capilliphycus salinus ALCB114379]|uniref:Uma2 family endonuclease n=1 Tax=Capilliphycus salinus TaxID=2768948 RepID=UPI0039A6AEA6